MSPVQTFFKPDRVELSDAQFRQTVKMRAGFRCELRLDGCTGNDDHAHHVHRKGQGGLNVTDNGLCLCHSCHGYVHANTDESAVNGWLRRTWPREGDFHFVAVGE